MSAAAPTGPTAGTEPRTALDLLVRPPTGRERRRGWKNRFMQVLAFAATAITVIPLLWIIGYVLWSGLPSLTADFLTHAAAKPDTPGALNAILGSLQMVPIALLISGTVGLLAGIYLAE